MPGERAPATFVARIAEAMLYNRSAHRGFASRMLPVNPRKNSQLAASASAPDNAAIQPVELPVITFAADGCVMCHWHGVVAAVWATQATLEILAEFEKLLALAIEKYPKVSAIHLVMGNAPLPPSEARAPLRALVARYANRLACIAIMLEGTGFWLSAVRGVLTSLQVFERRGARNKIFFTVEELADCIAPAHSAETGDAIEVEELRRVLNWLLDQPSVREKRSRK